MSPLGTEFISFIDASLAWEPVPQWGKKEKIIGERSEPRGSRGRGKGGAALSPPQATAQLASLAHIFPI